jgi:hypothetical protein
MTVFTLAEDEKRIFLVLSPSRQYCDNIARLLKEIQEKKYRTVLISVNQPSAHLAGLLRNAGIDDSRIFFIDAITRYAGGPVPAPAGNCRYVGKPGDLTAMSIAVTETLKNLSGERPVIFFDSVNAMLIYSNSVDLSKFIHFVMSKLRILNIAGLFLAVEKGLDPILVSQLTTFADELIEFP